MTDIEDLIAKQRMINEPELDRLVPSTAPEGKLSRVQQLLRSHENATLERWEPLQIQLAGEVIDVELGKLSGRTWCEIDHRHPPTTQADLALGWNRDTLPRDYPCDRVRLRGEHPPVETWQAMYDLIDAEDRRTIAAVVWWLNWGEPEQQLADARARDAG